MRRLLWLSPLLVGVLIGFTHPAESSHTRTYYAYILPASGSGGHSPVLTCGFHGGSCGTGGGDFLDWDNTSTSYVYFRGIFKRSGAPYETNRLRGYRIRLSLDRCDAQDVAIIHSPSSTLLGYMRYLHISTGSTGYFPIATSEGGVYNAKHIGSMTRDTDCGAWSGTHVHAGYKTSGAASRSKNTSRFPSGDYCTPGVNCRSYTNTSSSNWTHRFRWSGS
ncbi:MAG TPA: hypothetical protein VJ837_04815 [Candidatus Paceibacterota bacterium]|nr:hypothetical protein [Candidatus Paceibacterota bacterium]